MACLLLFFFLIVLIGLFDPSLNRYLQVADAFHDCVQSRKRAKSKRLHLQNYYYQQDGDNSCAGGICVGMTDGPHQGGNASYPLAWNGTAATRMESYLTVPEYPRGLFTRDDFSEITYYIWTDIFFGDESLGRMNQLVPQLILGQALDGSSGSPKFDPEWREIHTQWTFGAHYFFEVWNPSKNTTEAHAAYGELFATVPGETLKTTFELAFPTPNASSPAWTLTMSVVGDPSRTSILTIPEPYMGLGKEWEQPSKSWLEPNFSNLCINACWELYGATDTGRLPGSGAEIQWTIEQPLSNSSYEFTTWEQDEGNGGCPSCEVTEAHTEQVQEVMVQIDVSASNSATTKTRETATVKS